MRITVDLDEALLEEAGRRLIALGGTMPDAWIPERKRPLDERK